VLEGRSKSWEDKLKSWEGKKFRNIHTGHVYEVTGAYLTQVIYHNIVDRARICNAETHYKTFVKNFVPVEEEVR